MDRRQNPVLLFLVSAFIMFINPGGTRASCCCPTFWTAYNGHCYRLFSDLKTWHEAEAFCNQFSVPSLGETDRDSLGHLVSINSPDENNFVVAYFESTGVKDRHSNGNYYGRDVWIGLHDISTEGSFEWTDESPFNFTMWSRVFPQPDNFRGEDCGEIKGIYDYYWNDRPCDDTIDYFMCKLPIW
ncbi:echinoidin-like [Strongylocentrotus purpuratus]|uniref:C-type lectin domain-containing protein n=1 Tax=Strongylocentrotus purpuratus TaxID=7668 RepID=A0A7M7HFE0_STRPU|nr:echinoidin-like [Strongylocentrotus purpuratus]